MTAAEVGVVVRKQIGDRWAATNLHGVSPVTHLVDPPRLVEATDVYGTSRFLVWTVVAESLHLGPGYAVVYSEPDDEFGLLQFAEGYEPCLLGLYGDFWSAFNAM